MANLADLLPIDDALARTLQAARALRDGLGPAREVALWDAQDRVLAEAVVCDRDDPPFDRSAMDGFAVRSADCQGAESVLRVTGTVLAGDVPTARLGPGEAMAIMTGAPVPEGADAVQRVERTTRDDEGSVRVEGPIPVGQDIAARGVLAAAGAVAVPAGRVINGLTFGVLAGVGATRVRVYERPRVTVIATGSELVPLSEAPGPGQIRDSNRTAILGLVERHHGRPVDGGIIVDDEAALRSAIRIGLRSDILVLSGGVSAGVRDLVGACLEEEGVDILFHKVRIRPGKPVLVGRHAGGLVFGLPGNPVSAFVTAKLLLVPALRVLGGRKHAGPFRISLPLAPDSSVPATRGRTAFFGGRLAIGDGGAPSVLALPWRGSADQYGFADGGLLIRRAPGSNPAQGGAIVECWFDRPFGE